MGKILIVVSDPPSKLITSNNKLGDVEGKTTGVWYEELASPYFAFKAAGHELTLASPAGGEPPVDGGSMAGDFFTEECKKFQADADAQKAFKETVKLSECDMSKFDAVFYPGGHGPLWDLVTDEDSIKIIEAAAAAGKPIGAVCHGPCVFKNCKGPSGEHLLKGKKVTGFTNSEEEMVQLTKAVPFLLEDMLKESGGEFFNGAAWNSHVVTDGKFVTGQNPQSSPACAEALLKVM